MLCHTFKLLQYTILKTIMLSLLIIKYLTFVKIGSGLKWIDLYCKIQIIESFGKFSLFPKSDSFIN